MTMISSRLRQVYCQVVLANTLSKPAKEIFLPTHELTGRKHEKLTIDIGHLVDRQI
jgi:hypothetical protein